MCRSLLTALCPGDDASELAQENDGAATDTSRLSDNQLTKIQPFRLLVHVLLEPVDGGDPGSFCLGRVIARTSIVVKRVIYPGIDLDLVGMAGAVQLLRNLIFCDGEPGVSRGVDREHGGLAGRQAGYILRRRAVKRHRCFDRGTCG